MDEKKDIGRPRRAKDLQNFALMLPPSLIDRVRVFKVFSGKTINDITASALYKYFTDVMTRFPTNKESSNELDRLNWAKMEIERFESVTKGIYDFIDTLQQERNKAEKLVPSSSRAWLVNDIDEQINRAEEDIQLTERRKSYYRNIIICEGRI